MAKKKNVIQSLNIDGKSCCMFSAMDNNPDNVLFNIFHVDVLDNIEVRGLENIISLANFLLQCNNEYANNTSNGTKPTIAKNATVQKFNTLKEIK